MESRLQSSLIHEHMFMCDFTISLRSILLEEDKEVLTVIKRVLPNWVPNKKYEYNRTIIRFEGDKCVGIYDIDVWYNIISCQTLYEVAQGSRGIECVLNYFKNVIRTIQPSHTLANNVEFKFYLYPLSQDSVTPHLTKVKETCDQTFLETKLPEVRSEYYYVFKMDDNYNLTIPTQSQQTNPSASLSIPPIPHQNVFNLGTDTSRLDSTSNPAGLTSFGTPTTEFGFGGLTTPSTGFGTTTTTTPSTGFGTTTTTTPSTGFGTTTTTTPSTGFGTTTTTTPSTGFGTTTTTTPSTGFGTTTTTTPSTGFGTTTTTTPSTGFGTTTPSTGFGTTTPSTGFDTTTPSTGFGGTSKPSTGFGTTAPSTGFGFSGTSKPPTGFGGATTPATGFGFGGATTPATGFGFGGATTPVTGFGSAAQKPNIFSTTQNQNIFH